MQRTMPCRTGKPYIYIYICIYLFLCAIEGHNLDKYAETKIVVSWTLSDMSIQRAVFCRIGFFVSLDYWYRIIGAMYYKDIILGV